jgi:hypothetical protein
VPAQGNARSALTGHRAIQKRSFTNPSSPQVNSLRNDLIDTRHRAEIRLSAWVPAEGVMKENNPDPADQGRRLTIQWTATCYSAQVTARIKAAERRTATSAPAPPLPG